MLDAHEFADAVGMVYEAAALPELWPKVIERLAEIAGCAGGLLFTHAGGETNWVTDDHFRPSFQRFMDQGWMLRNARMAGLLAHGGTGFVSDHDLFTDEELAKTALYRDFLVPEGFGWGAATHVKAASGENIIFTLERRYDQGPVSRREIEVLDGIRPHLARATVLAAKLRLQKAEASLASFETVGAPAALIGKGAVLLAANPGFDGLLGQVVTRSQGRIALADGQANALVQKALTEIAVDRLADRRSIAVPSCDDSPAFILHIMPIRRQAHDIFSRAEAMLVVTTADRSLQVGLSLLSELYDLTRTEASIANGLLEGLSIDEIANSRGVGRETVRSQVKKVLGKTGCRSQADFIRRLAPLSTYKG